MTTTIELTRRTFLKSASTGLTVALATPYLARAETQITVADPGGPYSAAYREAFYEPFEAATGIKINAVTKATEANAQFKAMVDTRSFIWDVAVMGGHAGVALEHEAVLEPLGIEQSEVPDLIPGALTEYWLGLGVWALTMGYRTDQLATPPSDWAQFWNVDDFPALRGLRRGVMGTLEIALMADGVAGKDLYPLDLDRAFASLDRIKPSVAQWWQSGGESTLMLQSGSANLIFAFTSRIEAAKTSGIPTVIEWNQGLTQMVGLLLPKGGPKGDVAKEFVKFCADAERQAIMTRQLPDGPTNTKAYQFIAPEVAQNLPTYEKNISLLTDIDAEWYLKNYSSVSERFQAWILT